MDLMKYGMFVVWKRTRTMYGLKNSVLVKCLLNVVKINGNVTMVNVFQQIIYVILIRLTVKMDLMKYWRFAVI